jgi:hypothetical protein
LHGNISLCIVIFNEERFLFLLLFRRIREIQLRIGKLIGMMKIYPWITGSLCTSDMTGRRVIVSQEQEVRFESAS